MAVDQTFAPAYGRGVTASVTATSAASELGKGSKTLCLTNTGDKVAYVRIGESGLTATTADREPRRKARGTHVRRSGAT